MSAALDSFTPLACQEATSSGSNGSLRSWGACVGVLVNGNGADAPFEVALG